MKITIEIPAELHRRLEEACAREGRSVPEVAEELFRRYLARDAVARSVGGEPLPEWFGSLREHARRVESHDMEAIRETVARRVAEEGYLEKRARRGSREKFEEALAQVPDVEPEEHDRL